MRQTAVVIAPGRGTYNAAELGYLKRHHGDSALFQAFDTCRIAQGQEAITALDGCLRYLAAVHTRGDNASPLIYACGLSDFGLIDQDRFEIIGVTGNSMGWYTALACAGALDPIAGFEVTNTMGSLMQKHMIGGQIIYPFVNEDWREVPGQRDALLAEVASIARRENHILELSINLGGMLVLAGNATGLAAFEHAVPRLQGRYPMRLANHAGFHSHLQNPISKQGFETIHQSLFEQPKIPLIDGRGGFWHPKASDLRALYQYTLGHQVVQAYDFTAAISTAARDLMPDVFIILGPGTTLRGVTAQSLIQCRWRNWSSKDDFQTSQKVISLGIDQQRKICTRKNAH